MPPDFRATDLTPIELPSAVRAADDDLRHDAALLAQSPVVRALLDAVDTGLLLLDSHRQILASNLGRWGLRETPAEIIGLRPGEALGCAHAGSSTAGCGTQEACRTCGALRVLVQAERAQGPAEGECLLTADDGEPREFHVRATPTCIEGRRCTVLTLRDISAVKRREALERVFFHDVLNTVGGLVAWSEVLRRRPTHEPLKVAERIASMSSLVAWQIKEQRDLVLAEKGELAPAMAPVGIAKILETVQDTLTPQDIARDRVFEVRPAHGEVETDSTILLRVLTNMVKNALEATPPSGTVRLWSEWDGEVCAFFVWNRASIPRHVAARVFQRSFTTHAAPGRGLGTYSMKLLGERCLKGEVSFRTDPAEGTTFTLRLPAKAQLSSAGER